MALADTFRPPVDPATQPTRAELASRLAKAIADDEARAIKDQQEIADLKARALELLKPYDAANQRLVAAQVAAQGRALAAHTRRDNLESKLLAMRPESIRKFSTAIREEVERVTRALSTYSCDHIDPITKQRETRTWSNAQEIAERVKQLRDAETRGEALAFQPLTDDEIEAQLRNILKELEQ